MRIAFVYSQPRKKWATLVSRGQMPDHVLYGASWLKKAGHTVEYWDSGFSQFNLLKWPYSPLQRLFLKKIGSGFQIDQATVLLPRLNRTDTVIATNDSSGLPLAYLKSLKLLKRPLVYFHIGFNANLKKARLWKKVTRFLLNQSTVIVCFSKAQVSELKRLRIKQSKLKFIPPAVDIRYFKPVALKPQYDIAAIGRDSGRDYATLVEAIKNTGLKAHVVCDPKNLVGVTLPANVTVEYSVPYKRAREIYHQANIIVVPAKKNVVSGQVSFLEALACGKPVIAADIPALKETFGDKSFCLYYRPENAGDLRRKINQLIKDRKLQQKLSKNARNVAATFSTQRFSRKLAAVIHST